MDNEKTSLPGFNNGLPMEQTIEKVARNSRGVFMETLEELVKQDNRIILIVGDVGFSYMEEFEKKYPKQYKLWRLTQLINYGLADEKLDRGEVKAVWAKIKDKLDLSQI